MPGPRCASSCITPPLCSSRDVARGVCDGGCGVAGCAGGRLRRDGPPPLLPAFDAAVEDEGVPGDGDGPPCPGFGLGRQDLDDVGRKQLRGDRRRGSHASELAVDRVAERSPGVRHAAAEDDPLDVVGHHQQVDGPGEPPADVLDEVAGAVVAGGRRGVDDPTADSCRRPAARRAIDGPGGERLEAAALAARADRAVDRRRWHARSRRRGRAHRDGATRRG